jgi:phosphoribosylanthranilate isomerase
LTRDSDLEAAVDIGADAIGLVLHAPSSRAVEKEQAQILLSLLPPFVTSVGLFVDAEPDFVRAVLERAPFDSLQFHGEEPPDY